MHKLLTIAIISAFLLSGCSLSTANAKMKKEEDKQVTHSELKKGYINGEPMELPSHIFQPKGTISVSKFSFESSNVTLSVTNRKIDVPKVEYHIWRTADGQDKRRTYTSNQKERDFSIVFTTNDFSGQRGEYHVEAYDLLADGTQELLAKTTLVFQQYVPILMYHAIDDYKGVGLKELFVPPNNFEAQMRYLKENGFTLLTFEHWNEVNQVNKPILITFDDGMKNNMNALRVLQELKDEQFQPTATEYVIAGYIDSGSYRLSTEDIKEMVDSGIFSIQSHTMSHADLPKITNYEEELHASKDKIEQITGKPVIAIAYPYGHYDERVMEETKKYYKFATTTKPGQFIETGEPNEMLLMHRVRISYSTTIKQFAALVESN